MEIKEDQLFVKKVKITDRNIYTKTNSHVSSNRVRNDVYIHHSTSTDHYERVYYEDESGKSNYIEVVNQNILLKKDGFAVLATIGNELVAYKNEGQTIEFSEKLTTSKKTAMQSAGNAVGSILYFIFALIPIVSLFFLFVMVRDARNDHVFKEFFKYKFAEENIYILAFLINILGHVLYFIGFNTNSTSVLVLGGMVIAAGAAWGLIFLFRIGDKLVKEVERLKKIATERIEKFK